jgi:uncharacterized membrane protein
MEATRRILDTASLAIELVGVLIIALGIMLAAVLFVRQGTLGAGWSDAYRGLRSNLGRGILLGLELLVAADIIETVSSPLSLNSVGLLAAIVAIRTFLSFALETEIEGCWPWERARQEAARERPDT